MNALLLVLLCAYLGGVVGHALMLSSMNPFERGTAQFIDCTLWPLARPILATAVFAAAICAWRIGA